MPRRQRLPATHAGLRAGVGRTACCVNSGCASAQRGRRAPMSCSADRTISAASLSARSQLHPAKIKETRNVWRQTASTRNGVGTASRIIAAHASLIAMRRLRRSFLTGGGCRRTRASDTGVRASMLLPHFCSTGAPPGDPCRSPPAGPLGLVASRSRRRRAHP